MLRIVAYRMGHDGTMKTQPITLYGIRNCDTVRKARAWLDARQLPYAFHDFKTQGLPPARLDYWLKHAGWEVLLNRKGTAWRRLAPHDQAGATDSAGARALMLCHSSLVKRPVVEWGASTSCDVTVGFRPDDWQARLGPSR